MAESLAGNPSNQSLAVAALATRPAAAGDGVAVTWPTSGPRPTVILVSVESDGTDRTLASPTGGTAGAEIWIYRADRAGAKKWWLVGYLNARVTVDVRAAGGYMETLVNVASLAERIAIAGTPSLAAAVTYYVEPAERNLLV